MYNACKHNTDKDLFKENKYKIERFITELDYHYLFVYLSDKYDVIFNYFFFFLLHENN